MSLVTRWDAHHGLSGLQEQVNRLFESSFPGRSDNSALTTWAPAVDIYETENELVVKADLPDVSEKDLDVRIENNTLTIRGAEVRKEGGRGKLSASRAHLRFVQSQLQPSEHRE